MLEYDIDRLLGVIAWIAWLLFIVYSADIFIRTAWREDLLTAIIRLFSFRVLLPFVLTFSISLISLALNFVQPQEVAVVISAATSNGIRPQPLRPGLHWIIPFLERSVRYPTYWQTYTMSNSPNEGAKLGDDSIRARTSDGQEVRLDCSVIFRVDIEQAVLIHTDWQERYIEDFVRPVIRGVVRTQVSQFKVDEVNSSARADLEAALNNYLRIEFADKGLVLDQFLLRDITFTPEYASSIEQKQMALQGQVQRQYEAEQIRNLALGRADAVEIEAQAQARALKLIAEALEENPELITYQYVEKLSPNIRVMLVPSNSPLILPLPDLEEAMMAPTSVPTTTLSQTITPVPLFEPAPVAVPTALSEFVR